MLINFNQEKEFTIPCMNNGKGMMTAKMFVDNGSKIIPCTIHKGGSIGLHCHEKSDDINFVLSGKGKAVCDGIEEIITAECCHICKKGSKHSITNIGDEDLVLLTMVVER